MKNNTKIKSLISLLEKYSGKKVILKEEDDYIYSSQENLKVRKVFKKLIPYINKIALLVRNAVDKGDITVLKKIKKPEYKFGAYAVNEAWAEIDSIIRPIIDYKKQGLNNTENVELIDMVLDALKDQKLIYLEW